MIMRPRLSRERSETANMDSHILSCIRIHSGADELEVSESVTQVAVLHTQRVLVQ